jgi:hypothetical protein
VVDEVILEVEDQIQELLAGRVYISGYGSIELKVPKSVPEIHFKHKHKKVYKLVIISDNFSHGKH